MSQLSAFFNQNAIKEENVSFIASKRFVDEAGKPIPWELTSVTSDEDEGLRKDCTKRLLVPGKSDQYMQETDYNKYMAMLAAKCTLFPNLNDAQLQDSYQAKGAEQLLKQMLKPGEYQEYLKKVQAVNGFNVTMNDLVDEAKN